MAPSAETVPIAFVPGILSLAQSWSVTMPEGSRLVPVEYRPMAAGDVTAGTFGDFIGVMALRLLAVGLRLGASGPWAMGAHSAGGPAVYQCLDYLAQMQAPNGTSEILRSAAAASWLPEEDLETLSAAVEALGGKAPRLPEAVMSFEGSLMPCDVLGWAEDWAKMSDPPGDSWIKQAIDDPQSQWTWDMARECSGALVARCASEPPRHLASISSWLRLHRSPGFIYVAGSRSEKRNKDVFPALRNLAMEDVAQLRIEEIPGAGHNLHREAPNAVRNIIASAVGLPHDLNDVTLSGDLVVTSRAYAPCGPPMIFLMLAMTAFVIFGARRARRA